MSHQLVCLAAFLFLVIGAQKIPDDFAPYDAFLNYGAKKSTKVNRTSLENSVFKSKVDILGAIFRKHIEGIKTGTEKVDLVFLIDASSSVGETNFLSEIKFVKKLLSDFTVSYDTTRVAIVTFSSQNNVLKNIDQITDPRPSNNKCVLLKHQLGQIKYTGGGTYTFGAFLLAKEILSKGRKESKKVIFLITDGFSNGGDPVPIANKLKKEHVTIFTLGIKNGNYKELYDLSSQPGQYYSYLLDSYGEFESLARRALHSDLYDGDFVPTSNHLMCNGLCERSNQSESCCDKNAICTCGLNSGQYNCQCNPGYYGSGLKNSCHLCANGTYSDGPNFCIPCPDINHITEVRPALNVSSCVCKKGYKTTSNQKCEIITCPELKPPEFGYFVKKSECSNILNNACGVRCQIGYRLTGDSIRLCQSNATWSGIEPKCEVKVCPILKSPKNGAIECFDDEGTKIKYPDGKESVPVDTQCKFTCDYGYNLVGSKTRNCLPVSKWDGLNTYCKQIKCAKLPKVQFATYDPKSCSTEKQQYGQNCTVMCNEGFKLKGAYSRTCIGKYGHWSEKTQAICEDVTAPVLDCPKDVQGVTAKGKNHGFVEWELPKIFDNSGLNLTVWTKPVIKNITTFKFKLGKTNVTYVAMDAFKNKASCTIIVEILDKEPPIFENCIDPPIFLSNERAGTNITWDEPTIYDNVHRNVTITKSREFGFFPIGTTAVEYKAIDSANNTNVCVLNITVQESKCDPLPDPIYGKSICKDQADGVHCIITCHEGYGFAIDTNYDQILTEIRNSTISNDTYTELICNYDDPIWFADMNDGSAFPDCTITEVPKTVSQDGVVGIETEIDICNDSARINELEKEFSNALKKNLDEGCDPAMDCKITNLTSICGDSDNSQIEEETNTISKTKRSVSGQNETVPAKRGRKKHKINVKFRFTGKNGKESSKVRHVSFERFKKIRERIRNINMKQNQTETKADKFYFDVKIHEITIICDPGYISKFERCVKCPKGSFHNATRNSCQSCPIGYFNDKAGRTECTKCPELCSTRRLHSKTIDDCKAQCPPGTRARKRTIRHQSKRNKIRNINPISLMPFCISCPLDHYQDAYGTTECTKCPHGYVTSSRGAASVDDCVISDAAVCWSGICNHGDCVLENDASYYSCNCKGDYIGSNCETKFDSCVSSPCMNDGKCVSVFNTSTSASSYVCECPSWFSGMNCEIGEDACARKTCENGGTCTKNEDGEEVCACTHDHVGDSCEIEVQHCDSDSCDNGGICFELDETFACTCTGGYIGKRCDLLPCDFIPCGTNEICVNLVNETGNTTKDSYRCECPNGYRGHNCTEKINFCETQPCLSGGTCTSNETDFSCECSIPFEGRRCEDKVDVKYVMKFPRSGTTDFVTIDGPKQNLTEISVCLWIKTKDSFNYGTIVSYATSAHDNAFTITDYNGIVLYVNGKYKVTDINLNDGRWHFFCVTWENTLGTYKVYTDGTVTDKGTGLANGTLIRDGGKLVIGQEQDRPGGLFSQSESFLGELTNLDIWDHVLDEDTINKYMKTCDEYNGNLIFWGQFKDHIHGDIQISDWTFCRECPKPRSIYLGYVTVKDGRALYFCDAGYFVRHNGTNYDIFERNCTKSAMWQGSEEPTCTLISCDFPGRIANGYIEGKSYYYGDTVTYYCEPSYELVGMRTRTCLGNGTWSYMSPYCMGSQCAKLKAPENSSMTVLSEQVYDYEFETLRNTYDVGTQLEFVCFEGTRMVGESIITCIENGTWDTDPPICECFEQESQTTFEMSTTEMTTTQQIVTSTTEVITVKPIDCFGADLPAAPPNGYFELDPNVNVKNTTFDSGSLVFFKCRNGYQLHGYNFTMCSPRGVWTDVNQRCKPIQCPHPPKPVKMTIVENINLIRTSNVTYYFGNMIKYVCVEGYELYGSNIIRCQGTGKWSRLLGRCARVSCNKPIVPSGSLVIGTSYLYQDKLKIECPVDAYQNYIMVQCSANGTWVPEIKCYQ